MDYDPLFSPPPDEERRTSRRWDDGDTPLGFIKMCAILGVGVGLAFALAVAGVVFTVVALAALFG